MFILEFLKAIFIGIVEGITEWLPISSTGHMVLVDEFISLDVSADFMKMFLVVIQLGAILAVPLLFFNKLNPFTNKKTQAEKKQTVNLWLKVIVGVIPAATLGLLLDEFIESKLENAYVVSAALIVYGIAFIIVEWRNKGREYRITDVNDITYKDALIIGSFQVLSLVPGTSRSGSTILGGIMTGVSRKASAEFSFFMAIPVMVGASLLKIVKFIASGTAVSGFEIALLLVAFAVSFVVSLVSIKFLMEFVKRHSFTAFGIYRIALGIIVLAYFGISYLVRT